LPAEISVPLRSKAAEDGAKAGSRGLEMKELRGRPVLIDFWTYSCVNCIRALPHLKRWHGLYSPLGLVIVGVHTPEFDFEKNVENVARAIKELGVEYPVAMDSDYQIWSSYSNNVWPRKFLVDKDGQIVYDHSGEGNYRETEEAIQKVLLETNPKLKLPTINYATGPSTQLGVNGACYPTTPETYLGSMRGRSGNVWRFAGDWKVHPEYVEHQRKTENFEDYIVLNFEAAEVNLVMECAGERPAKVRLELGGSLPAEALALPKPSAKRRSAQAGASPTTSAVEGLTAGGRFLKETEVRDAKMYNLISGDKILKRELKIYVKDQGLRAYAFTFGGCV